MKQVKISDFDVSEYLEDEESIAEYLNAVLEDGDSSLLLASIGDIAKARGMSKIAKDSGLGRESLYKALNAAAKPRFDTILKVLQSLGVHISISTRNSKKVTRNKKMSRAKVQIPKSRRSIKKKRALQK